MSKTILITGATDGIGLETAKRLVLEGHRVLIHGRNDEKLAQVKTALQTAVYTHGHCAAVESYLADLSDLTQVQTMAKAILAQYESIDVLINNAGVYATQHPRLANGADVRFVVNTLAPLLLTQLLWPAFHPQSRVVNLSSAAQSSVDLTALRGEKALNDGEAYAQSKLALTMWSRLLGLSHPEGPVVVAINPKSFLGSKMVKDAYGIAGSDLSVGADILYRAALGDEFATAHGQYYDNDIEAFSHPPMDALNEPMVRQVVASLEALLTPYLT
ncbi:hypothetical protein VST7929_01111 [Vibrio stylophorae]|uniref:Oxidoreductase n=1 Tax=Vibrio stylophorae TaxID=659351 RepID=A0ABM8ZSH3_9VIBR|nr:SDR family NAD(P)-dependent oxidoreductase [Vibrio stylophorae]CAH0533247.1 hypothetical protein VST7929_01111 [Vibrio stylophorae]